MIRVPMMNDVPLFDAGAATPAGGVAAGGADPGVGGGAGQPVGAGAPALEATPGGQPPAAPEDPEHEVSIDGQTQRVKLSELTAGYSRHADYTQKTQALASDRRTFDTEKERLINEGVQAEINRILESQAKGGEGGEGNQPPDQMSLLQNKVTSLETRHADEALDRSLVALQAQYPELKTKAREDAFLHAAQANGIKDLKDLPDFAKTHFEAQTAHVNESTRAMFKDPNNAVAKELKEAIIKEYLESKAGGAPPITQGLPGTPPNPAVPPPPPGSIQASHAIDDQVVARLRAGKGI